LVSAAAADGQLDVVVRMHDARRLAELDRAVFSLIGQTHRPLHILLCTQRFTPGMLLDVRQALAPLLSMPSAPTLEILNYEAPRPLDARSALANLGITSARGRYIAFLDYDDTLYPEAYELLIDRLRRTEATVAFGSIVMRRVLVEPFLCAVKTHRTPWRGKTLLDHLADNSCPIHSFVIDRTRLPPGMLFETDLVRHEDYDFLLRVCAACRSDFALMDTNIGNYYHKSDGSNSVLIGSTASSVNRVAWRHADNFIVQRRRATVVAPDVQQDAGLAHPIPGLTIHGLLGKLGRGLPRIA
jgi:hypothetical protein